MCEVFILLRYNYITYLSYLLIDNYIQDRIGDVKMKTVRLMLAKAVDKNADNDAYFIFAFFGRKAE
jgi:hypothetical protein